MMHTLESMLPKAWSTFVGGAALLLLSAGCASSTPAPATGGATPAEASESSALDYYVQACNAGEAEACSNAARVLTAPASPYHDDLRALTLRTKACDGNAYFCGDLGHMYFSGKGVAKDEKRGLAFLDKGCTAKNATACSTVTLAKARPAPVVETAKVEPAPPVVTAEPAKESAKSDVVAKPQEAKKASKKTAKPKR